MSEGCRNCYAEAINLRLGTGLRFKPGHRKDIQLFLDERTLDAPLRWKKPRMVFVCSMTDLFADFVPDEWIDRMFATMALCPRHTFQVLTKRPQRMLEYVGTPDVYSRVGTACAEMWRAPLTEEQWPLPNVWLGVSVEDQAAANARVPHLLATPAAIRFLSCEPLLGPIDLTGLGVPTHVHHHPHNDQSTPEKRAALAAIVHAAAKQMGPALDWVICGGESGPDARPMHPDWARSLRDQCAVAGVAFFFKQWGEWFPRDQWEHNPTLVLPDDCDAYHNNERTRVFGDGLNGFVPCHRVGKSRAGRLLDGCEWNEMPGAT